MQMVEFLIPLLDDKFPLIRSISCWTVSRFSKYIVQVQFIFVKAAVFSQQVCLLPVYIPYNFIVVLIVIRTNDPLSLLILHYSVENSSLIYSGKWPSKRLWTIWQSSYGSSTENIGYKQACARGCLFSFCNTRRGPNRFISIVSSFFNYLHIS